MASADIKIGVRFETLPSENEKFFIAESIRHARALPFSECIKYLDGFLRAVPESYPAASSLRSIYRALHESDQQLDLIQVGQIELGRRGLIRRRNQ